MIRKIFVIATLVILTGCHNVDDTTENHGHQIQNINYEETAEGTNLTPREKRNQVLNETHNTPVYDLSFKELKEKWNAITINNGNNLFLQETVIHQTNGQSVFSYKINHYLKLNGIVQPDGVVTYLEVQGLPQTQEEKVNMLTAWSYLIYLLSSDLEPHMTDELFSLLDVGPNANLSQLSSKEVKYKGKVYKVLLKAETYIFSIGERQTE